MDTIIGSRVLVTFGRILEENTYRPLWLWFYSHCSIYICHWKYTVYVCYLLKIIILNCYHLNWHNHKLEVKLSANAWLWSLFFYKFPFWNFTSSIISQYYTFIATMCLKINYCRHACISLENKPVCPEFNNNQSADKRQFNILLIAIVMFNCTQWINHCVAESWQIWW